MHLTSNILANNIIYSKKDFIICLCIFTFLEHVQENNTSSETIIMKLVGKELVMQFHLRVRKKIVIMTKPWFCYCYYVIIYYSLCF